MTEAHTGSPFVGALGKRYSRLAAVARLLGTRRRHVTVPEQRGVEARFIHSGGHAWPEDLERLVTAIAPKHKPVWVHTDAPVG